jgi:hypothetical protein
MRDFQWKRSYTYASLGSIFFLLLILATASNFTQGTIAGSEPGVVQANYSTGQQINKQITVSRTDDIRVDTNDDDGDVLYVYVKEMILDGSGNVIQQSDWKRYEYVTYEATFEKQFDTTGERSFVAIMATAESSYNSATGEWSDYNITEIDRTVYTFNVRETPDAPSPDNSLSSFLDNLIQDILQLLG